MKQFLSNFLHHTKLWLQRLFFILLFLVAFYLALQNQGLMTFRLAADWQVTAPTIVVVILTFFGGVVTGALGVVAYRLTRRGRHDAGAAKTPTRDD